jgi:C4-type Zn-finger protein
MTMLPDQSNSRRRRRGTCPVCGRWCAITKDRRVVKHRQEFLVRRAEPIWCPGAGARANQPMVAR